ncbi:FeoA family protein [Gracilimonas mengyeensis]|uniref:FeoA family protein n=1 Tax=Gracilimonas mengyeensis TaxID=1302730 RepID=UPI00115B3876|nr:FeoA family protein [Gracilimonas mengyeensis]
MLLSDMKKSGRGVVSSIAGKESRRLLEIGITPGCVIEVIRLAQMGFPVEVKVRGCLFSLQEEEARCIAIQV